MLTALLSLSCIQGFNHNGVWSAYGNGNSTWTFKLFWGPVIDSFIYEKMGKRRPWILFAQIGMALSLVAMIFMGDISENISLLGWMFFLHNCFASLQDVSCDALAVDVLLPEEQGKVNGAMWGSKIIGTGTGAAAMGTLLVSNGLVFTILVQTLLMLVIMIFPLFILERPGEKRFPWSKRGDSLTDLNHSNSHSPLTVIKDLITAFSKAPCYYAALFIIISAINQGINGAVLPVFYNATLGWESDTYSQVVGGPGTILEFFGAILGGVMADRFGRRKVFFGWGSFSVLSGIFGFMILSMPELPVWFQGFYLIAYPLLHSCWYRWNVCSCYGTIMV